MRYAQILNNKVHWLFETDETLKQLYERFAPDMVFVNVTHLSEVQEGWDYDGESFTNPHTISLATGKEQKRSWVNNERDRREQGGFLFDGKLFDSDQASIQRLSIATQNALAAQFSGTLFSVEWKLTDNTCATLDAEGMLGVAKALADHCDRVHAMAQTLKQAVEKAETLEELEAIVWPQEHT